MRPQRPKGSVDGRKSALEWPKSHCSCRHLKHRASALAAAGVVQTFPQSRAHSSGKMIGAQFLTIAHHLDGSLATSLSLRPIAYRCDLG